MTTAANTDLIQATIEITFALVCLIVSAMLSVITGKKMKSEKTLWILIRVASASLVLDSCWFIFDGNTAPVAIALNRFTNFSVFVLNPTMLFMAGKYMYHVLEENGTKVNKRFPYGTACLLGAAILLPIANLFYPFMYSFSASNVYYRLTGWYVFVVLNILAIVWMMTGLFAYRRGLDFYTCVSFYLFLLSPIISTVIQAFVLGISFIQIGLAIAIVVIFCIYLRDWIRAEKDNHEISEEKKKLWLIESVFMIVILCISASIAASIVSASTITQKNSEQNSRTIAYMVNETIDNALIEPLDVSRVMAQSDLIRQAVQMDASELEGSVTEQRLIKQLSNIQKEFGFYTVFVSSGKTHSYYTADGFSRYMDIENDPKDAWYKEFRDSDSKFNLNVDEDKDKGMSLAVFVNMSILDDAGNRIGVCGVSVPVDSLVEILREYEDSMDIEIILTDADGVVQLSTDIDDIETRSMDPLYIHSATAQDFSYTITGKTARLVKHLEEYHWYLLVMDHQPEKVALFEVIRPGLIIYVFGLILTVIFLLVFRKHEKNREEVLQATQAVAETDKLTELYNRYSYEKKSAEIVERGDYDGLAIVLADINGLKEVNDNIGHLAGDELIIGAAICMRIVFEPWGLVFRTGGDEFVVIAHCSSEELARAMERLEDLVNQWRGEHVSELSLSYGTATREEFPDADLTALSEAADKRMYMYKAAYYKRTGKERRKHYDNEE